MTYILVFGHTKFAICNDFDRWHCSLVIIIKLRTLKFAIFCFHKPVGFRSQKKIFSRIALKIFLGMFHQISRLFFFFARFFLFFILFILLLPPFTPRTNGDYLLRPRTRYKKSKDMPWKVRKWSR